jgi:hypothetical protein
MLDQPQINCRFDLQQKFNHVPNENYCSQKLPKIYLQMLLKEFAGLAGLATTATTGTVAIAITKQWRG